MRGWVRGEGSSSKWIAGNWSGPDSGVWGIDDAVDLTGDASGVSETFTATDYSWAFANSSDELLDNGSSMTLFWLALVLYREFII